MDCLPLVARSYTEIFQRLGVRKEDCGPGRVTLLATTAPAGGEALASLSELALAAVSAGGLCDSALGDEHSSPPMRLRIGLVVARKVWSGPIRATAHARPFGARWLLTCELRDEQHRLLSTAFAHVPD